MSVRVWGEGRILGAKAVKPFGTHTDMVFVIFCKEYLKDQSRDITFKAAEVGFVPGGYLAMPEDTLIV